MANETERVLRPDCLLDVHVARRRTLAIVTGARGRFLQGTREACLVKLETGAVQGTVTYGFALHQGHIYVNHLAGRLAGPALVPRVLQNASMHAVGHEILHVRPDQLLFAALLEQASTSV